MFLCPVIKAKNVILKCEEIRCLILLLSGPLLVLHWQILTSNRLFFYTLDIPNGLSHLSAEEL